MNVYKCMLVKEKEFEYGEIRQSDDVVEIAKMLGYDKFCDEHVAMFCIGSYGQVLGIHEISHGTVDASLVQPSDVFKRALLNNSSAIILVHNHPSGKVEPSKEDIETTDRLKEAGRILGVKLVDHVIIGHGGESYSMNSHNFI